MIVDELISDDFHLYKVCLTDLCGGPMKGDFCDDDGDDSDYCLIPLILVERNSFFSVSKPTFTERGKKLSVCDHVTKAIGPY